MSSGTKGPKITLNPMKPIQGQMKNRAHQSVLSPFYVNKPNWITEGQQIFNHLKPSVTIQPDGRGETDLLLGPHL